jgi:hypothetical protein
MLLDNALFPPGFDQVFLSAHVKRPIVTVKGTKFPSALSPQNNYFSRESFAVSSVGYRAYVPTTGTPITTG